jgi:hypothetical protein
LGAPSGDLIGSRRDHDYRHMRRSGCAAKGYAAFGSLEVLLRPFHEGNIDCIVLGQGDKVGGVFYARYGNHMVA